MLIRRVKYTDGIRKPRRKAWFAFIWGLAILAIGILVWVGVTGVLALKNITAKNNTESPSFFRFSGEVPPEQLKAEGDGRVNVLVIGIGGAGHPGGLLADTIQIVSIDPINKTMGMLSLPRDLYVSIPGNGKSKINAVYSYGIDKCNRSKTCSKDKDAGADALKETVSSVLDVPIHYFVRIDFDGFEKIIDTLGGIQVYVDRAINDPLFPDEQLRGYAPLYIPAGLQTFNGDRALKYARSRHSNNGEGSDFARAARQQKVIKAVSDKALNINILANPKKVTDLISILGNHLRTDLTVDDMRRLATLIKEVDSKNSTSKVLDTSVDGPLKSLNDPKAGYIIIPKKGLNDFSEVQEFALTILKEPYLIQENAKVLVVNASGSTATGKSVSDRLKRLGYNVVGMKEADNDQLSTTIKYFSSKPYTISLLNKRFTLTATKAKSSSRVSDEDIQLTVGANYKNP